ncbi:MAG: HD-GYP domain-containing protein, partial [Syntrophomonadaceae bacterium]|nr:HD-GYP domain-containing protein [Syntrophomonadaceae bacterium]
MRRVNIQDLKINMVVARPIYSSDGRILLQAGVALNENYIKRLHDMGISSVYIKDDYFDDISDIPDVVSVKTRIETTKTIRDNFQNLEKKHKLNTRAVKN